MILVLAIAAAIIYGCLRGANLSRLSRLPLRAGWLALGALIVQMGFFLLVTPEGFSGWPAAMGSETRLWLLSDIFVIPKPLPFTSVLSIGDLLLAAGAFIVVYRQMLSPIESSPQRA